MKKHIIKLIVVLSMACISPYVFTEESTSFAPQWEIGDSWSIKGALYSDNNLYSMSGDNTPKENIRKAYPFTADFNVTKIISTNDFKTPYRPSSVKERVRYNNMEHPEGGYKCFEIQVAFPKGEDGSQSKYILYIRIDTMNLIRILNNSVRSDGSVIDLINDYCIDPNGPLFTTYVRSTIPFDWPDWRKKDINVNGESKIKVQQIKEITFSDKDGKSYDGLEITMGEKNRENDKYVSRSIIKWKKGQPWWSEIKQYDYNGEISRDIEIVIEKEDGNNKVGEHSEKIVNK
ncbi:MAG: hypothetical protein JW787_16670 [Sedimentisphaerales bacterium]|nr:hypothetical protein [Sedimentisphaerales bacterium]